MDASDADCSAVSAVTTTLIVCSEVCAGSVNVSRTERRQRNCHTLPHAGSHGKAEAPLKLESQEGTARSAAPGARRTPNRGPAGFPAIPTAGAEPDRACPRCAAGGSGRTHCTDRLRRRTRRQLAGDRYPARGHQAGGPPALPASPSRRRHPSGSNGLSHRWSSARCQASGGICKHVLSPLVVDTGLRNSPSGQRKSRHRGPDNGCCPIW
jgi:hypothetical protein